MRRQLLITFTLVVALALGTLAVAADPLPSWNEGEAKRSVVDFVQRVTTDTGADFVPVPERIAVFDNDGTLWAEKPMYVQLAFAFDRVQALGPAHPEWKVKQPFKAVLEGDLKTVSAYVGFQREWFDDPDDHVRIGRYDTNTGDWAFYYYPIDTPTSPNGGWVGLSEITALGGGNFAVIERDNQTGTDARTKKIYEFSVKGIEPKPQGEDFPVLAKSEVRDLIPDLKADNRPVLEKVEGFMVTADGKAFIVTDNDGVEDSSGETQLINLGSIF